MGLSLGLIRAGSTRPNIPSGPGYRNSHPNCSPRTSTTIESAGAGLWTRAHTTAPIEINVTRTAAGTNVYVNSRVRSSCQYAARPVPCAP